MPAVPGPHEGQGGNAGQLHPEETSPNGRTFASDDDLNAQARCWLNTVANVRIHGTLKQRPVDRFEAERPLPMPLAVGASAYGAIGTGVAVFPALVMVECRPLSEYTRVGGTRERAVARGADRDPARRTQDARRPGGSGRCACRSRRDGQTTAAESIEGLLAAQVALRNGRRLEAAMRSSRPP